MTVNEAGELTQLSVSEAERFDMKQTAGCPRAWWFERKYDLKGEETRGQQEGTAGHELLRQWFEFGRMPAKRTLMGKAVTGAILKGDLPVRDEDMVIESRLSGQQKYDASGQWIPLDTSETLWLGGVPWEGFIDLAFRRGDIPEIWDHKFGSDIDANAKQPGELIKTIQMPVYVLSQIPYWPDAKQFRIVHNNVSKRGVYSFIRGKIVTLDQVLERKADVERTVGAMKVYAKATAQDDLPTNPRACDAYGGCAHQSICSAYNGVRKATMTPEDQALFDDLDAIASPKPASAPPAADPFVDDEEAAMEAKLAAIKAKKAAAAAQPRKLVVQDVSNPSPDPKPAPSPDPYGTCERCTTLLSADNASKLADGRVQHIGCPKAPASIVPTDAPKSKPELASEQPAAPKPAKERKPKQVEVPLSAEVGAALGKMLNASEPPESMAVQPGEDIRTLLANLLDDAAKLLRAAK